MTNVSCIVRAVGHKDLAKKIGVVDTAITNAVTKNQFPAKWYGIVQAECSRVGVDCPDDLFAFVKGPQTESAAQ